MKKIVCLLMLVLVAGFVFGAGSPTPVPDMSVSSVPTVRVSVVGDVTTVNGALVVGVDSRVESLIVGVIYIYNADKTRALVVMEVPEKNLNQVRQILKKLKKEIKKSDEDKIEREFKGYRAHMGKNK